MDTPLENLPHWARVAFVARCARRIMPVFDEAWPNAPSPSRDLLLRSIQAAEESARAGQIIDDVRAVHAAATRFVGRLTLSWHTDVPQDMRPEVQKLPDDPDLRQLVTHCASVAPRATETALADPARSHESAAAALSWATEVAGDDSPLADEMLEDLESLAVAASLGKWTHQSPVVWKAGHWATLERERRPWWRFW